MDPKSKRDARNGTRLAVDVPFDRAAAYGNWWWGFAPSTFKSMLEVCGFDVLELSNVRGGVFGTRIVARKRSGSYEPLHPLD